MLIWNVTNNSSDQIDVAQYNTFILHVALYVYIVYTTFYI